MLDAKMAGNLIATNEGYISLSKSSQDGQALEVESGMFLDSYNLSAHLGNGRRVQTLEGKEEPCAQCAFRP